MVFPSSGLFGPDGLTLPESFERTSPLDDYLGDTGGYTVATTDPFDGSYHLEFNGNDDTVYDLLADSNEWSETDFRDKTYEAYMQPTGTSYGRLYFAHTGTVSTKSAYSIEVDTASSDEFKLRTIVDGGSESIIASFSSSITLGNWHRLRFSIDTSTSPNTIRFSVYDEGAGSSLGQDKGQNDDHTTGYFGTRAYTTDGGVEKWDYFRKQSDSAQTF